jgi:hypothetical protein
VKVYAIIWGPGTYLPEETRTTAPSVASFFTGVTNSPYLDWLNEYDTNIVSQYGRPGTNEHIGRGSFAGVITITPGSRAARDAVTDSAIQSELKKQMKKHVIPKQDANTLYAIFTREGQQVSVSGETSGVNFCAYHDSFGSRKSPIRYAVMPYVAAVTPGCASVADPFANLTIATSHELIEAMTDPDVGFANGISPAIAWLTPNGSEIGDLCAHVPGGVLGSDGRQYTVQKQWDNATGSCFAPSDQTTGDFSAALAESEETVAQGGTLTVPITTESLGDPDPIHFSVQQWTSDDGYIDTMPPGTTVSVAPSTVTPGNPATLTVQTSAATPGGSWYLRIHATDGGHSLDLSFQFDVPAGASDFALSLSPSSATVARGGSVVIDVSSTVTSGIAEKAPLSLGFTDAFFAALAGYTIAPTSAGNYVTGQTTTLTIFIKSTAPPGPYDVGLFAEGANGSTQLGSVTLTVTP